MKSTCIKLVALATSLVFAFSTMPELSGAQFYFQPRKRGSSELGLRIPFGEGSQPDRESIIDKLKEEETSGTGTAVALIVLGACIVAAAVVIANKADDITEEVSEKVDQE